jgi:predicted DNA-binding mobile mystery protein A
MSQSLVKQHLEEKFQVIAPLKDMSMPSSGWIKAIRTALGMSLLQLGKKLQITKQSVLEIEKREKDGSITLKTMKEVARALDMQLVYGFVPIDGSLDALIDKKAKEVATKIVMRTSNTMQLEDQGNSSRRIEEAIKERTETIKKELPKILWD